MSSEIYFIIGFILVTYFFALWNKRHFFVTVMKQYFDKGKEIGNYSQAFKYLVEDFKK